MPDTSAVAIHRARDIDAEALLAIRRDPITRRYQPLEPGTLPDLRRALAERGALPLAPTASGKLQWVIDVNGEPAGWITVDITLRKHHVAAIGYALASRYHGRGIMPAALSMIIPIAFDAAGLALERLEAVAAVDNIASRRVLEKTGFGFEGISRGLLVIAGERVDHARYALLRSDTMAREQIFS